MSMQRPEDATDDLHRVLLENYLMLGAAIETQNMGRLPDMLQFCQKVHSNLLEVVQQIEEAPTLAMTANQATAMAATSHAAHTGTPADEPQAAAGMVGGGGAAGLSDTAEQALVDEQQQLQQQQPPHAGHGMAQQASAQMPSTQQQRLVPQLAQSPAQAPLLQQQRQQPLQQTWVAAPDWLQHVNVSVAQLLNSIGLSQYVPLFEQQQVDMAALQLMEERHLRELGLPLGAVVKVRAALAAQLQDRFSAQ